MSADSPAEAGGEHPGGPSEEELRAAYEAELSRLTATDVMAQTVVSLLHIAARRLGPAPAAEGEEPGRQAAAAGADLEQVREAIDAVRALLEILERRIPQEVRPLRDALSRLQMAYAGEVQAAGGGPGAPAPASGSEPPAPAAEPQQGAEGAGGSAPGPAEASGRLWVPGR